MTSVSCLLTLGALALAATTASAQFVKGNEAVKVMSDGSRKVQTPSTAGALLSKPCPAEAPGCWAGNWKMLETPVGLMECTEIFARPGTCRRSTYGAQKLPRVWIVMTGGQWMQCQFPDLQSKCVSTRALPYGAVQ